MSGQNSVLPEIISKCKKSIIPITGIDANFNNNEKHLGTALIIGSKELDKEYILTCEHVVFLKDSTNRVLNR